VAASLPGGLGRGTDLRRCRIRCSGRATTGRLPGPSRAVQQRAGCLARVGPCNSGPVAWPESGRRMRLGSHSGSGTAGLRAPARLSLGFYLRAPRSGCGFWVRLPHSPSLGFYRTRTPTHPERLHLALGATESESCRVRAQRPILPSARPSRLAGESWQSRRILACLAACTISPRGEACENQGTRQPRHETMAQRSSEVLRPTPLPPQTVQERHALSRSPSTWTAHLDGPMQDGPMQDGPCRDSSRLPPASVRRFLPARPPAARVPAAAHALRAVVLAANHATSPAAIHATSPAANHATSPSATSPAANHAASPAA
jgi:hypothetical protein